MSYTIIWERGASEGLKRLRDRDGDAVKPLVQAISALARNPEPTTSGKLGNTNLRRLRVGVYRAAYEFDGGTVSVKILMVGSTAV
ncbi:type II toxin-antitoxin system RelE/ParE family toxin [Streptomyces sp. CA-210063]|uniref:type II toxin-antitoxin system RelE family toxin n=1 Tax=Streptomyces sp. CA-210063 TaxID=2801029 RepID=UPI00214C6B31|nr:type II toxin-antitoxin system RelE/ParE family toxin [Streptomyces sp. CA-210063]UUU32559.1 type II toxin-antitoxin system RelE/ParE family toxin [Streptomyces sp. CA-210063]